MPNTSLQPLSGKTVLITGALGGLGRAITDAFATAGAAVAIHHLNEQPRAEEAVRALAGRGSTAFAVEADISSWDAVETMVQEVEKNLGPVDILINNAGMMTSGKIAEMSLNDWRETMSVDLDGVFLCSRLVLPGMLNRGAGVIVNLSSQLAFKGARDFVSYCTAKAGVAGFTRALAREVGPVVRVNAIAPGPVDTPFIRPWATEEWRRERTRDLVIRRLATPEEIAPTVVFLASPAGALYHGQVFHLNGGGVMF